MPVALALSLTLAIVACGVDRVTITPTAGPTAATTVSPAPSFAPDTADCDGTLASTPWARFAAAFNAGRFAQAAAQFGGDSVNAWWDPTDSDRPQQLVDLPGHFADLARLGVRLPATIKLERGPGSPNLVGLGLFVFDDHGFTGEGDLVCQTGRLTRVAVDAWPRAVAGRAPLGGSGPQR